MNNEEKRFQAAVAAMRGILTYGGGSGAKYHEELAKISVGLADALLAELGRTKRETETPQPGADGWIPHRPGDPMPCDPALMVSVKHGDGVVTERCTAVTWGCCHDNDADWWTGEDCLKEDLIVAWKPA